MDINMLLIKGLQIDAFGQICPWKEQQRRSSSTTVLEHLSVHMAVAWPYY